MWRCYLFRRFKLIGLEILHPRIYFIQCYENIGLDAVKFKDKKYSHLFYIKN